MELHWQLAQVNTCRRAGGGDEEKPVRAAHARLGQGDSRHGFGVSRE